LDWYACCRTCQRAYAVAGAKRRPHGFKSDDAAGANDENFRQLSQSYMWGNKLMRCEAAMTTTPRLAFITIQEEKLAWIGTDSDPAHFARRRRRYRHDADRLRKSSLPSSRLL
jgi:hypothetical protein